MGGGGKTKDPAPLARTPDQKIQVSQGFPFLNQMNPSTDAARETRGRSQHQRTGTRLFRGHVPTPSPRPTSGLFRQGASPACPSPGGTQTESERKQEQNKISRPQELGFKKKKRFTGFQLSFKTKKQKQKKRPWFKWRGLNQKEYKRSRTERNVWVQAAGR